MDAYDRTSNSCVFRHSRPVRMLLKHRRLLIGWFHFNGDRDLAAHWWFSAVHSNDHHGVFVVGGVGATVGVVGERRQRRDLSA